MDSPKSLTILYDESCGLCRRARDWLLTQPCRLPVELLPAGAPAVRSRFASVAPWMGRELVVVDERGRAWIGPSAFLMCLWATARYRATSHNLARPSRAPHAERFFRFVSDKRSRFTWSKPPEAEDCSWCNGDIVTRK